MMLIKEGIQDLEKRNGRILPASGSVSADAKEIAWVRVLMVAALMCCLLAAMAAGAVAAEGPASVPAPGGTAGNLALEKTIQTIVVSETKLLAELRAEFNRLKELRDVWKSAANAYRVQISTYQSIPVARTTKAKELDWAWKNIRASEASVAEHIGKVTKAHEINEEELLANRRQISFNKDHLKKLQQATLPQDEAGQELVAYLRSLIGVLTETEKIRADTQAIYTEHIAEFKDLHQSLTHLALQFEEQLEGKKKENLFTRSQSPLAVVDRAAIAAESLRFSQDIAKLATADYWRGEAGELWRAAGYSLISYGVLFILGVFLLVRVRLRLRTLGQRPFCQNHPVYQVFLTLIDRSALPGGITLIVYLVSRVDTVEFSTPSLILLVYIMGLWVFTGWGRDFIRLWHTWHKVPLPAVVVRKIATLFTAIRWWGSLYMLLSWGLNSDDIGLTLVRIVFEVWSVIWLASLWKTARLCRHQEEKGCSPTTMTIISLIFGAALAGLSIELTGYGNFASYWYLSWGRSVFVAFWWGLFFYMLREWDRIYHDNRAAAADDDHIASPIMWLSIRFGQFVCLVTFVVALILSWGGKQAVLAKLYATLGHPLQIGNMKFSLLGVFYAVLVLLITQAVSKLWRFLFHTKFLSKSGLVAGLQDSITTLTSYVVWMFGILISLHVFGLNTASLAVAFGALGIGLGFGLQNIFNNFISGIILLFERPIQIGDDVEINGIWATIKKINFRSTVVQTYDNASLIIPNSEFVSSQVTNWSFKDRRVRRKIIVGVAYGSDISLVRQTLLEVSSTTPRILKYPKPDVLFSDFGDSALIFTLRIWTPVDNFFQVESEARFEIDRLFRERDIEISFPQRDLHLRTLPSGASSLLTGGSEPGGEEA